MRRLTLPCRCVVLLDDTFTHGERRVVCEGGDPDDPRDHLWERCPGGRGYLVRAERIESVFFDVTPLKLREAS